MRTTSTGIVHQTVDTRGFFSSPMIVEVQLSADGEEVSVAITFDPIIVSNHQAELMLDTYLTILNNLFHSPQDTPLRRISALSPDHIIQIGTVNGSSTKPVRACVHDLVRKQVGLSPFLTAIDSWDGSMTYAESDDLSTSLAQKLSYLGIKPEKAVCVLFEKSKWTMVAMLDVHIPVEPQHTAYILFTSGSTGLPKGVVIEHQALCSSLIALTNRIGMGTHSRTLQFNSYWFAGMLLEIFGTLIVNKIICGLSESARMNDLAGSIERIHANTITTLATSVSRLIEPSSVPSLETVCLGGEPVLPSDRDRWASKVVNPLKDNELAPLGGIGELFIEGPGLARHYLNDEDKSAATFVSDQSLMAQEPHLREPRRVYKTGDLVRMGPDGTVTWISRKDSSQVKIRGQRVELAEIEEVIRSRIPQAIPVAVDIFAPSNNDDIQILGAVMAISSVVPGGSSDQVATYMQKLTVDLVPKLKGTLPHHMVPSVFIPLSDLPFLSTGKLDRKTLHSVAVPLAVEMSKGTATISGQAPRTPKEKLLIDLWT
ncbi:hypothetical protein NW768_012093 [Fusarium equiseti]|uniref:AMP-dependent synthetase/ligase domain-containing protein n=1 Tax=Fusarium equiseti TaxID=61235 RepID=A0ABQ8QW16_FUSEQ|nr:hypothetical protein NW768_012093 [Fusarium equiseti]